MLNLPLISIAVCTYNGKNHLHEQLQSLVNQDYQNKEIVIIDDNSIDGTFEILKKYESEYSCIKLYQNEKNLGYIKNFELAISLCMGDFIALSDQDDVWHLKKLSTLQKSINSDSILIYHDSALVDYEGKPLNRSLSNTIGYLDNSESRNLLLNNCIAGHSVMFRNKLKDHILPFYSTIPHDHWLAYVASIVGRIQYLSNILVNYRQHNFSLTYTEHAKDNQRLEVEHEHKNSEKLKLKNLRINHLKTLKLFNRHNAKDLKFIDKLIELLANKSNSSFAFSLFFFLTFHHKQLFSLYHKSFMSTMVLIFKECKS
ncbi:glycosyltransferase [Pedobacter lithocola]|uniref:Glycosyltransferase n=1 Tax=Pedobacter lithocola TaxID=1908239 RepID=A0ABV8PCP2_9SPHI